eukprot:354266-Chlamydomonas_euryale.AAC.13
MPRKTKQERAEQPKAVTAAAVGQMGSRAALTMLRGVRSERKEERRAGVILGVGGGQAIGERFDAVRAPRGGRASHVFGIRPARMTAGRGGRGDASRGKAEQAGSAPRARSRENDDLFPRLCCGHWTAVPRAASRSPNTQRANGDARRRALSVSMRQASPGP